MSEFEIWLFGASVGALAVLAMAYQRARKSERGWASESDKWRDRYVDQIRAQVRFWEERKPGPAIAPLAEQPDRDKAA